jgi:hypothetical protein
LYLPGHDIHLVDLTGPASAESPEPSTAPDPEDSRRRPAPPQPNIYNERIEAKIVTFGITNLTEK